MYPEGSPKVTVYIPTRNRAAMLRNAVESLRAQTFTDFEAIIVDDASTDSTPAVLDQIVTEDSRFRTFRNVQPLGACLTRNRALEMARSPLVTGLDDDDVFLPWRLAQLVQNHDPRYAFLATEMQWNYGYKQKLIHRGAREFDERKLLSTNMAGSQVLVERDRALAVGGFDPAMPACQDWDLWVRLCQRFGAARRISGASYIVNTGHDAPRVTRADRKISAYEAFRKKHGHRMDARNHACLDFLVLCARRQRLGPVKFFRYANRDNLGLCMRYLLASNLRPLADARLRRLRSR
jgi:GT2 family glycosyltransferase